MSATRDDVAAHVPRQGGDLGTLGRWFAMLGGILAWAAAFMLTYPLAVAACESAGARIGLYAVTLAAALIAAAAALAAWRGWRRIRASVEPASGGLGGRDRFMSFAGLVLGSASLLLILAHGAVLFLVSPCA